MYVDKILIRIIIPFNTCIFESKSNLILFKFFHYCNSLFIKFLFPRLFKYGCCWFTYISETKERENYYSKIKRNLETQIFNFPFNIQTINLIPTAAFYDFCVNQHTSSSKMVSFQILLITKCVEWTYLWTGRTSRDPTLSLKLLKFFPRSGDLLNVLTI